MNDKRHPLCGASFLYGKKMLRLIPLIYALAHTSLLCAMESCPPLKSEAPLKISFRTMFEQYKQTMLEIMGRENLELKPELANQIDPTLYEARKDFLSNREAKLNDADIVSIAQRLFNSQRHLDIFTSAFRAMPQSPQDLDNAPITPKEFAIARIQEWKKAGNYLNRAWHQYLNKKQNSNTVRVTQSYFLLIYLHVACFWPLKDFFDSEKEMHTIYFEVKN
jgi:hypothetical protein